MQRSAALCLLSDYRYPYLWSSGSAPGSQPQAEGLRQPLKLQHQQAGSGDQLPSSVASSQSYDANRFQVVSGSNAKPPRAPEVPAQHGGYVGGPVGSGAKAPGFIAPPQFAAGTSGASSAGSVYQVPPSLNGYGDAAGSWPAHFGPPSAAGLPWAGQLVGGAGLPGLVFPNQWLPSSDFWQEAEPQSASETIPLPPPSYIIQSRNGYVRARELQSHTKYLPEYFEAPTNPFQAAGGASQAAGGASAGQKV